MRGAIHPAGSYVEIGGGISVNGVWNSAGTNENPVFVGGISYDLRPTLTARIALKGTYLIIENLKFIPADSADLSYGISVREGASYISMRNIEIDGTDNLQKAGTIGLGSWGYAGTERLSYVLIDGINSHDVGDVNATFDQDAHSIVINGDVDHVWVVNSTLVRSSGDGLQIEAQSGNKADIHHIYFGNNISYGHRQTGAWIKHASGAIMSSNELYSTKKCAGQQYIITNMVD